jgi:hypothetical protein
MIYVGFEIEIENADRDTPIHLDNIYNLIDKTTHITGWKSKYGILDYHRSFVYTNAGKWGVENDASMFNGAEFVSPAEEKDDALHVLEEFFSYIDEANCCTLTSCGLHLNISADNKTVAGMDRSYFLSNINQGLLHALWGHRLKGTNIYCTPIKKILADTRPLSILDRDIQDILLTGKYRYVNSRTSNGNSRLEIRVMGGENYHKKIKEIKATTNMFCNLLEESYEKSQPKSKKRIISYINRIQNKKPRNYPLWVPTMGQTFGIKTLFHLLNSIKVSLKNTKYPEDLGDILENRIASSYSYVWEDYCYKVLSYLRSYIDVRNIDKVFVEKATQKINEAFYYIFKHLDRTDHNIPVRMFDLFLNGHTSIINGYRIILTVPKDEKATDVIWLCKHSEKLSDNAKTRFVNNLSLSALRFIKKKEIATMEDIINNREKQLIEEKDELQ